MKKVLLLFTALIAIVINAVDVNAQTEVYADGNAKILQFVDSWQVLHGRNMVAHGDGILDVKNLPSAFKDFLNYYSRLPLNKSKRISISKKDSPTYGPLLKTQWNQDSPYNNLCPESEDKHTLTGCTTIASAQLMFYYGYCLPINVSGNNYTWCKDIKSEYISNVVVPEDGNGATTYDYNYSYTPDFDKISSDATELSKFIVGIAFAQQATFGLYSTSTVTYRQISALKDIFGYECETYEDITSLDDRSLIANAIKQGMPVLISGDQGYGGHSFIIDGYNGTEYHINYGWGGSSDGWFTDTKYPENNIITIARPNYENFVCLQDKPKKLHISGNGINKTVAMVQTDNGDLLSYKQSEEIELEAGEYEFYFEYADGNKIAPYTFTAANLEKGFTTHGRFTSAPAKIKLSNSYKVDFCHNIGAGEIKVFCSDLQVSISGKVLDKESGQPMAGAFVSTSATKPTSEALQKNENETGYFCVFSTFAKDFVPTRPYITEVDFRLAKYGTPNGLTVSILDGNNETLWQKTFSGEEVGNSEWEQVVLDQPLQVTTGKTYYLSLFSPENEENFETGSNYFRVIKDEDWEMLYRIWSSENNYVITDKDGAYNIKADKHSSGKLYAYYDKITFEPLSWEKIQQSISEQDFNGLSNEVTISGKVLDKKSGTPIVGAIITTSETKPICDALQKNENNSVRFCVFSSHKIDFVPTRPYIIGVDFRLAKYGTPNDLTVSIQNEGSETLWQKTFSGEEVGNSEWEQVVLDQPLQVSIGENYSIILSIPENEENYLNGDNYLGVYKDKDWEKLYRIWSSEKKYVITDKNGTYNIKVDRYSSGKLYAYYDKTTFEPLSWEKIQQSISGQDFNGLSNEVTISGKVLDKDGKPMEGAYVTMSETQPIIAAYQKNDGQTNGGWSFSTKKIEFVPTKNYLNQLDFMISKKGDPDNFTVSIQDENQNTIWEKVLSDSEIENDKWKSVILDSPLEVSIGTKYYLVLSHSNPNTTFYYVHTEDDNIVYRIWSSDDKVITTDSEGNYSIKIDRYSTETLYAYYQDKKFNSINFINVINNISKQNFEENGKDKTIDFNIESIVVKSPSKIEYIEGQSLNLDGGMLSVIYNNGETTNITLDSKDVTISGYDSSKPGEQTIFVEYSGKTATFTVIVTAKVLEEIAITTNPEKLLYIRGEAFDLTGGVLTATYNDKSTEKVAFTSDQIKVSGFDGTQIGKQTITVEYGGKTATFEVTINAEQLVKIEVTTLPTKVEYIEGQNLEIAGGVLTLIYDNNTTSTVNLDDKDVKTSGFDGTKIGKQSITVEYSDKTAMFEVTVKEEEKPENPEDLNTATEDIVATSNVKIWSFENTVYVENAAKEIVIVDMSGRVVKRVNPTSDRMDFQLNKGGIYIIKTGLATKKVNVQ